MTHRINNAIDQLFTAYVAGRTLALFFDYDGTLVPIVPSPRLAVLTPETRRLVRHLASRARVHVAVVSGRSLDDLKNMVGIDGMTYVGTSGLESELAGHRYSQTDTGDYLDLLGQVAQELAAVSHSIAGSWIEHKPAGVTWHYRDVATGELAGGRERALSTLKSFEPKLRVVNGPMALEIIPNVGVTKGTAVEWLCDRLGNGVLPVYVGDHENDREAFEVVRERGGFAIGVGSEFPAVTEHQLNDPVALVVFLRRLAYVLTRCE